MIKDMEITFLNSLLISAAGLGMVLLELALLAVVILIMSRLAERVSDMCLGQVEQTGLACSSQNYSAAIIPPL